MLALNHERVEYTRLDTDRDQLLVAESDMAARFPHRRSADGNLLPRPACRAGVPWDPGPFGQGLTHAQQGYDVPQGLHRPGAVGHPEQRLDPRAGPSHGLRGQATTEPVVHFYAAAPVHNLAAVDTTKGKLNFSRRLTTLASRAAILPISRNSPVAALVMTAAAASPFGSSDFFRNDVSPPYHGRPTVPDVLRARLASNPAVRKPEMRTRTLLRP